MQSPPPRSSNSCGQPTILSSMVGSFVVIALFTIPQKVIADSLIVNCRQHISMFLWFSLWGGELCQ